MFFDQSADRKEVKDAHLRLSFEGQEKKATVPSSVTCPSASSSQLCNDIFYDRFSLNISKTCPPSLKSSPCSSYKHNTRP